MAITQDEVVEGMRFERRIDPADPRFEIITIRTVRAAASGGPAVPDVALSGVAARNRFAKYILASVVGFAERWGEDNVARQVTRFAQRVAKSMPS